ncbi:hypothetical protein [Delftia tsuruhatensis]|uniref:hypothetical protein n=1 Tax=Delftia tsuruhatensis TaxID=180282 RepID=UPI002090F163|nr:hypothetical protein [Delftia tsuruhatensis]MCO5338617.1 hypothetical protein [Delftia tsuruhatensis]MCR4546599.1 hypothetical protein [Delftia tsuruhatensis]
MTTTVLPLWLEVIRAVAPLLAAALAGVVAWWFGRIQARTARQQAETAKNKLKLDLFDRRLEIYKAASEAIATAIQTNDFTADDERAYFLGIRGSRWLLDQIADSYLRNDLFHAFDRLEKIRLNQREVRTDEFMKQRSQAVDNVREQLKRLDHAFERFLRIET